MDNCKNCQDSILNPIIGETPYCIECAEANNKCVSKFPAECVIYHIKDDSPSNLNNLQIPNKTSVSTILEKIDSLLATNFNVPLTANDTSSIHFTTSGVSKHTVKADVKLSTDNGNILQIRSNGLFAGTTELGKVKVNSTDTLDYLGNQIVGGTDGIVSISTPVNAGLVNIVPNISVEKLIEDIRLNHLGSFNNLLSVSNTSSSVVNMQSKLAPYIAYAYHGSLTNFDNTGKGLASNGFDNIYICNGANNTPDYRGRSPIGANVNVQGPSYDSATNPSNPANMSIAVGQKSGAFKHKLAPSENAPHTHTVNDPGHFHKTVVDGPDSAYLNATPNSSIAWSSQRHNGNQDYDLVSNTATPTLGKTDTKSTGITINSNLIDNDYHNNTQPVVGTVFIMYIP